MIVEFIGSTGAGKTTLLSQVQCRLAEVSAVATSFEVAAPLGLRGVTHPTARNLIQEIAGLPFFLLSLKRHKQFVLFALKMLARHARFSLFTLNNLRSLERKIGVHEIIRRTQDDQIVLVDEGTILLAHNIFVYSSAVYSPEEIGRFASLVPLPHVIVYVKAPVDSLVRRSLLRSDPPRELRSRDQELIEKNIRRAVDMFDQLVQYPNIRSRLLIVENPDGDERGNDAVEETVRFIMGSRSTGNTPDANIKRLWKASQNT